MLDEKERMILENYGRKSTFASFLPGISGIFGIPIWCFYVNRGQCVVSFGAEDKDHSIMEFYPAHQAYQNVKRTGFRTFLKVNGKMTEPFLKEEVSHRMYVGMNELEIEEDNVELGVNTKVNYFILPKEKVGALVRCIEITNTSSETIDLELLDGMPAVVPYGVSLDSLKNMGQTAKAWMQVEDVEEGTPYFRVRASMADSTKVCRIEEGNFSLGFLENGERLVPIVDPDLVFSYDVSLGMPVSFMENSLEEIREKVQVTKNILPCSFYGVKRSLKTGECIRLYELYGEVASKSILQDFINQPMNAEYFEAKRKLAVTLTEDLCKVIETKTASKEFDMYCKQSYLDNLLRGGYPIILGKDKVFYVYSRKHGDLERDYNYFRMSAEFFSQGNGNFRDVNQNRRCDIMFTPYVGKRNIKTFYDFIQLDGYNPLLVERVSYTVPEDKLGEAVLLTGCENKEEMKEFLKQKFTPGSLSARLLKEKEYEEEKLYEIVGEIIDCAVEEVNADFGEGYWTDHWTYNLDLIENYLAVYPEEEKKLLFEEEDYTYFDAIEGIQPRRNRYVKTEQGIRQYGSLDKINRKNKENKLVCEKEDGKTIVHASLIEKLILLCTTKYATLDPYGMGTEMEGGKPGWYDALNGLPGLLGSSMAETYELCRMLLFTIQQLREYDGEILMVQEAADYLQKLYEITKRREEDWREKQCIAEFWNEVNDTKEAYRECVYSGISGKKKSVSASYLAEVLNLFYTVVCIGIKKAIALSDGMIPTYFSYEVTKYEEKDGILPTDFKVQKLPAFLEGAVRYLKLDHMLGEKRNLYEAVKKSELYDKKLSMYRVNASLNDASYEIGRARAFTPGWLENGSIWMHMEYKYLLELLKSGLYAEYLEDLKTCAVPFLDQEMYGRSVLENSSFIASSYNPNEKIHGKGFVARLSGSTAEFLNMWLIMMFGAKPFRMVSGELEFHLEPVIPAELIDEDEGITAAFLGTTEVTYHFKERKDYIPGTYHISEYELTYVNGTYEKVYNAFIYGEIAKDIRDGNVSHIDVFVK